MLVSVSEGFDLLVLDTVLVEARFRRKFLHAVDDVHGDAETVYLIDDGKLHRSGNAAPPFEERDEIGGLHAYLSIFAIPSDV